jgi:hypothetical protein
MAAGYGWAGGHYIPANSNLFSYLFQFFVLGILIWLSINFIDKAASGASKGLNIFSLLSFTINLLNIIHGAINTDAQSFGSHNTFADLVPIGLLMAGSGLWIFTIIARKKAIIP